ncbi:riboflavin synthase [Dehalogenimonas etheniformans]|uniref:Riboflavin synthase n=1 Tax=Dehalogenimonas etheniformans TaxID=1536648 RepID=A0A2P5P8N7_9CHLR|nr:riboflavin synthase [Dehalogenimonas etheniformans]PPD58657.1 riboflavin synthase subunit alpha [Dehalogenimonas etheniformans]QNT76571.1 riboflavin synthase [Dehalogenimonas etheniformans]
MFSGIIEETGTISSVSASSLSISASIIFAELKLGDSVAVNGVCLTVTEIKNKTFNVDVMPETLKRSTLGKLRTGDSVNLERALTLSGRLGGHLVEGHIDDTGVIERIEFEGDSELVTIASPPGVMRYVVEKGFIAVDGLSLTVTGRTETNFKVSLVSFTRMCTTMGRKKVGDKVNLEADIIAKYVENFMVRRESSLTEGFLAEHGFTTKESCS